MSTVVLEPPAVEWWGSGAAPHLRWPGVTIPIDDAGGKYHFDATMADRVCDFFPRFCSHSKGSLAGKGSFAGKKFELLDYQRELILRPLFGWLRADGTRRFRKAYIEIPKKNGKTQLIAGLALYMLLGDNEPGAEVYVAAADRDQARNLFKAAVAMVEANPYLKKRCVVYRNEIRRVDDPTAFFQVLSAEAATKHGPNIHCIIMDELHAQPDRELFETLTRGIIARSQPLIVLITTAGDDNESICAEEYEYAKRVLEQASSDEQHLPVIFEARPDDDPFDEAVWARVNPAMGETIDPATFAGFATEAKNEPRKRNDFLRYHLNRWVNQATAWIPVDWWDACEPTPIPDYRDWLKAQLPTLTVLPCAAGLDLAQKIDLACLTVCFREKIAGPSVAVEAVSTENDQPIKKTIDLNYRVIMVPFFWIPEETMREHEKNDGVPYSHWAKLGLVTPTEGAIIDYSKIYSDITTKILPMFPRLKQGIVGYDPAFATDIATQLRDRAGLNVLEVLQNYQHLSEVCYLFEALVKGKRVSHGGHRTFRNHVEHVAIKTDDARRIRPVKPKRAGKHIDGVVGGLIGLKALAGVPDQKKSLSLHFLGGSTHAADQRP